MEQEKRFQQLDFLRTIAAIMIALYHFILHETANYQLFPQFHAKQPGFQIMADAVLIFFAVSAIVLPTHLLRNNYQLRAFPQFIGKRMMRIYLPFLVAIFLILLVDFLFHLKNNQSFSIDLKQLLSNLTFSCSFTGSPWYNAIFWTLAIEMQFYIFIGLIFPLMRKYPIYLTSIVFIIGECANLLWEDSRLLYYYTPYFTLGFLLYLWQQKQLSTKLSISSFVLIACSIWGANEPITLWTIVVIPAVVMGGNTLPSWLSKGGKFSYSFYLIHGLIGGHLLYFLRHWNANLPIIIIKIVLAMVASGLVAYLFYRWIEQPSLKWGRTLRYKKN